MPEPSAPLPAWRRWQKITNAVDPPRELPPRHGIAVTVRLVFDGDGEALLDGEVIRWTRDRVCVELDDERVSTSAVWVRPCDVQRT